MMIFCKAETIAINLLQ